MRTDALAGLVFETRENFEPKRLRNSMQSATAKPDDVPTPIPTTIATGGNVVAGVMTVAVPQVNTGY